MARQFNPLWIAAPLGVGLLAIGSSSSGRQAVRTVMNEGKEWLEKVVARTSKHEGSYDSLNLNSDGAGLSFGMLQWSQRTGALGNLLNEMHLAAPAKFTEIFGSASSQLLTTTRKGSLDPVAGVVLWKEPWVSRFKAAGQEPTFRAVQDRLAMGGEYMTAAIKAARLLGIHSERAVSLTYDTAVQQGPGTAVQVADRTRTALQGKTLPPREVLLTYVQQASARFRSTTQPTASLKAPLVWKPVGKEWHVFAGKVDLYLDIVRRRTGLVNDSNLSDAPIQLS